MVHVRSLGSPGFRSLSASCRFALLFLASPLAAQQGNLVPGGRFDQSSDVDGWAEVSPELSELDFDMAQDADACAASGSLHIVADPTVDFGVAQIYRCVDSISPSQSYSVSADVLFLAPGAKDGRISVALTFYSDPGCTGTALNGHFGGVATENVTGWQHKAGGPATPDAGAESVRVRTDAVQLVGSAPAFEAVVDNVLLTEAYWIFSEDFEAGDVCRWSAP